MTRKAVTNRVLFVSAKEDEDNLSDDERKSKKISQAAQEHDPVRLFITDILLLVRNLALLPLLAYPKTNAKRLPGVATRKVRVAYGWTVILTLSVIELPLIFAAIPAFFILPGWMFFCGGLVALLLVFFLSWTTWGSLVVESKVDLDHERFHGEKWFFLNGIMTSHASLQQDVDAISATFSRPITGIHNRSYGIPFDLLECLVQRAFRYHTTDVRVAAASLTLALEDPTINKIVVIAHSQGGLILSLVMDRLYALLPAGAFSKLELYTLGSAASSFHNPMVKYLSADGVQLPDAVRRVSKSATDPPVLITTADDDNVAAALTELTQPRPEIPNQLIHTIEHYVNRYDMVPRWGVLYHILQKNKCEYSGRVFVHEKTSGHFFEDHYLSQMFPLEQLERIRRGDPKMFLNHRIHLEKDTDDSPRSRWWGVFRAGTVKTNSETGILPSEGSPSSSAEDGQTADESAPTVKQLSKLWRYMDGGNA